MTRHKQLTVDEAYSRLADRCALAEIATGEALEKLRGWGISAGDAFSIVQRLVDGRFIDDERYARAYVRERVNNARWGVNKIRAAMRQKGLDSDIIRMAIEEELDEETYCRNLAAALRSKGRTMPTPLGRNDYARLVRFAMSRGYEADLVGRMIADEEYWRDDEADD